MDAALDWAHSWRASPLAPLYVILAFVVGGLLVVPVTLLVAVTGILFGAVMGFPIAMIGALSSALVLYGLGDWLGGDLVRRFAGQRVGAISRAFGRRGILTVALIRQIPIAPFSLVNLVAGASHIRLRELHDRHVRRPRPRLPRDHGVRNDGSRARCATRRSKASPFSPPAAPRWCWPAGAPTGRSSGCGGGRGDRGAALPRRRFAAAGRHLEHPRRGRHRPPLRPRTGSPKSWSGSTPTSSACRRSTPVGPIPTTAVDKAVL